MSNAYEIVEEPPFIKQKHDYQKKYPSLPDDIALFKKVLLARPDDGAALMSDGNPARFYVRKSRMACKSLGKGQSGGFRVFYVQDILQKKLHLVAMAQKNDERDVDFRELKQYLELLK